MWGSKKKIQLLSNVNSPNIQLFFSALQCKNFQVNYSFYVIVVIILV